MITDSIEIARRPEEVFAYIDQLDKHGEWQGAIISTKVETEGPTRVGSRAVDTRKVPGGPRDVAYEITEHDPPRKASFRGLDGPVRPVGTVTVEALLPRARAVRRALLGGASRALARGGPARCRCGRAARAGAVARCARAAGRAGRTRRTARATGARRRHGRGRLLRLVRRRACH